ncbi:MAG: MarR family winged helix-turn-helix transcriptional regulator [Bacillota bacterium]
MAILEGVPSVMWFIRRHMRKHRGSGLSVPQFRMLILLDRYPTASLSVAAEHLGVCLPGASRMITGLVSKKLVVRKACSKDRRQMRIVLTSHGQAVLKAARQATLDCLAEAIGGLDQSQKKAVIAAMRLLKSVFVTEPSVCPSGEREE